MVLIYHLNKDSSYYCDYFYQSSGTRYTLRGAHCGYGYSCGSFFIDIHYAVSHNSWSVGASLSFNFLFFIVIIFIKPQVLIMFFVVVAVVMGSIVVSLMLIWTIRFLK